MIYFRKETLGKLLPTFHYLTLVCCFDRSMFATMETLF